VLHLQSDGSSISGQSQYDFFVFLLLGFVGLRLDLNQCTLLAAMHSELRCPVRAVTPNGRSGVSPPSSPIVATSPE